MVFSLKLTGSCAIHVLLLSVRVGSRSGTSGGTIVTPISLLCLRLCSVSSVWVNRGLGAVVPTPGGSSLGHSVCRLLAPHVALLLLLAVHTTTPVVASSSASRSCSSSSVERGTSQDHFYFVLRNRLVLCWASDTEFVEELK